MRAIVGYTVLRVRAKSYASLQCASLVTIYPTRDDANAACESGCVVVEVLAPCDHRQGCDYEVGGRWSCEP